MIKRQYFIFAKCYAKNSSHIFSQHWFGLTIRSWLPIDFDEITQEALNYVVSRSDYANGSSERVSIVSINRI